ncbi:hypothetical protein DACRYDRAFT_19782 [Dacryopinax primogenitus]|uniref:Glycopeptide n=1 Tax=Dacryopinax primogenitus (strain DJM 731) TaxID=1858805 RepID=M5G4N3_DACPD|nr:uncharacterized protein DACRYDRAFT_19782 [Dacryopinax primogenitus]EJU05206.1 hypothetical protein DACRYDRAFT_19782 [Dacryopinax primogenitus]
MKGFFASLATVAAAALTVAAETHTISFNNKCGHGTPTLVQGGNILSKGGDYTANCPFASAIAYLQTGSCGLNGEGCSMVELSLINSQTSTADVTLIPPHTFSVTTGFQFYGVCPGVGADCTSANCCPDNAFCTPTDYTAQRYCNEDNVNLSITFCD